jgi:hypothetical protein
VRHHRFTRPAALGLALAAFAAPTAVAQQLTPDARDAARAAQVPRDLRSPDTRDAAAGRGTFNAPDVVVIKLRQPSPSPTASASADGIDWADAGIGAASLLGLMLFALSTFVVVHRRQAGAARRQTATTG